MRTKTTAIRKLAALCALAACALGAGAAQASAAVPSVTNEPATNVTGASATLNGTVATDSALTACYFEYVDPVAVRDNTSFSDLSSGGRVDCATVDGNPISSLGTDVPADSVAHALGADIPLPEAGAAYYYRLVTTNGTGTTIGRFWRAFGFRISDFDANALQQDGTAANQAGTRPYTAGTDFSLTSTVASSGREFTTQNLRNAVVNVPAGLVANVQGIPQCTELELAGTGPGTNPNCPSDSQVGVVGIYLGNLSTPGAPFLWTTGIFNMAPPHGTPAAFGFNVLSNLTHVFARLRTGEDYGGTLTAKNAPEALNIKRVAFTVWGVPADPSHDIDRFRAGGNRGGASTSEPRVPFLTLPTSCEGDGPNDSVETTLDVLGWQGGTDSFGVFSHAAGDPSTLIPNVGCGALTYAGPNEPSIEARPTTNAGDAPSGLDVDLQIPQHNEECAENGSPPPTLLCNVAEAHLRDTVVTLPEGLVVNPSGANGLDGCSLSEFGYTSTDPDGTVHTTPGPASCPDASRLADVEVESPLLDHPIEGSAYIADPYANPFRSLIALYITIDDEQTGIVAKLAGEVHLDPSTGRITATFNRNPQLPFEHFRLHFFGGAGGSLRTPSTCGDHTTTSTLTPWSAPDAAPADITDTWQITQNCVGSAGEMPNAPSFDAGTVSPIAGAHSPFVVHLRREDGSQNFSAVTISPPQGLVATLAGTAICSEADLATAASKTGQQEKASPSCPAASEVGNVTAGAGAGPAPYYASGKAYMAGPYKGAPLSLAIVTPATAGPFDLGTIVVKTALYVDSKTAEIKAVSDPIPSILQGIPLDVKTVDVALDKPDFTLNPTSCNVMAVNGLLTSTLNQVASLSSRFQLGECTGLGFKPQMTLRLRGGTKRGKHPALTIALMPRPGDANIASVSVAMPRSEFLENAHIRTVCTRPDFAADNCPTGAVYGESTVDTPLLDYDLAGHVYLRSSDNLLPDVVPDLRGPAYQPIKLETAGRTDSIRGGIRTTIDFVPDAPFTKATVALQGGNKGLLVNSRNICDRVYRATVRYTAHNGLAYTAHPALRAKCGRKAKRSKRRAHRRR